MNESSKPNRPAGAEGLQATKLMHSLIFMCNKSNRVPRTIEEADKQRLAFLKSVTADDIVEACKKYVVGQEDELRRVAEYACLWLARYFAQESGTPESDLPTLNALHLIGSTASGKTFICRQVFHEYLGFNYHHTSTASITGEGWKGASISNVLRQAAKDQSKLKSEISVLFWDEIDKHTQRNSRSAEPSFNPLTDLLVPLEKTGAYAIPDQYGDSDEPDLLDTNRCIWVFAGAYEGIGERVVRKRLMDEASETYGLLADAEVKDIADMDEEELRERVTIDDLIEYGMLPEFLGRASYIVALKSLRQDDIARIVCGTPHSLEQRYGMLMPKGVKLQVTDSAARHIAQRAIDSSLGARMTNSMLAPMIARLAERARKDERAECVRVDFARQENRPEGLLLDETGLVLERIAL